MYLRYSYPTIDEYKPTDIQYRHGTNVSWRKEIKEILLRYALKVLIIGNKLKTQWTKKLYYIQGKMYDWFGELLYLPF